jgi:hypothetical protein
MGDLVKQEIPQPSEQIAVDTFAGKVRVAWDQTAAVTPLGQLPFFIDFLKTGGIFDPWVEDCPLRYKSPNSPAKRDVLGTVLLSVLAGHHRYAHMTNVRSDNVNPGLLGMTKVVSEDAVRRGLEAMQESAGVSWLTKHMRKCYEPLLTLPWIMDGDTTVKPLYGKQEGAELGHNPRKQGRPSHTYHTYMMANTRLILEVETQAGNRTATCYSTPGLWKLLENIPRRYWPRFFRGDSAWGTQGFMRGAEERGLPYLVKLRLTGNVRRLIEKAFQRGDWSDAGQGWEGKEERLKLMSWQEARRVVILRRALSGDVAVSRKRKGQLELGFLESEGPIKQYEYAVLATTLPDEILTIAQHYRDRADAENVFDELKNQWGWGGYTTQDLKRCRFMSRIVALTYNWWTLFVRLAHPDKHLEAITSRPLLLHAVARKTTHQGQTTVTITSTHGKFEKVQVVLDHVARFLSYLKTTAEQLTAGERWRRILSQAFVKLLRGKPLQAPELLPLWCG